ncbi:MAG: hypothetical protein MUF44_01425 [Hydrogenophaga sp.]|jgi:hypothetical protein|nr:hypothetical protein [Hydrogenophaga sp.]
MKKLWNGEVPLSVAYWVYGWLLPMGLALVFVILGITLVPGSVPAQLFVLVVGCYTVFWGIGTWRTASKYQGLKLWAFLAKAHIVAPLVLLAFAFATLAVVRTNQNAGASHAVQEPIAESPRPVGLNSEGETLREKLARPIAPHQDQVAAGVGADSRASANTASKLSSEQAARARAQPSELGAAKMDLNEARKRIPELAGLSDESALDVIHRVYYPDMDKAVLAERLGYKAPPSPAPERLGWLDQRLYESCQQDAAKAPTAQGVVVGLRICREKFGR